MQVAHEKLNGLDRDRLMAVLEPVLAAHGVDAVEVIWRSDQRGWVLYLTVEQPGAPEPGEGVTLDLCSEISRDLSAALDVADVIPGRYRLEVGSPGIERALYGPKDYSRFAGHRAKFKLGEPLEGRRALSGELRGLDDSGRIVVETDRGEERVDPEHVREARLVFEWKARAAEQAPKKSGPNRSR